MLLVRKGGRYYQAVSGPKVRSAESLHTRERPEWALFTNDKTFQSERPDYVRIGQGWRPVIREPMGFSRESSLRATLSDLGKDSAFVSLGEMAWPDGEPVARFEVRPKQPESGPTLRAWSFPRRSHAVAKVELLNAKGDLLWRSDGCTYREVDGVAHLATATSFIYGNGKNAGERVPVCEETFNLVSIETDPSRIPDSLFEAKLDAGATYYDEDLKSLVTSPEQIQNVLNTVAEAARPTGPAARSSIWPLLAGAVALAVIVGIATLLARRRARA